MPVVQNLDIGIEMDGERLREYDTRVDEGRTARCWIESQAGKQFSVTFKADTGIYPRAEFGLDIELDGHIKCSFGMSREHLGVKHAFKEARVGKNLARPFVFSQLKVTDDEQVASLTDGSKIGCIKVTVKRGIYKEIPVPTNFQYLDHVDSAVHERSKKIALHRASLGDVIQTRRIDNYCRITPCPEHRDPLASIEFAYRPKAFLQAGGVIPPDSGLPPPNRHSRRSGGGHRSNNSIIEIKDEESDEAENNSEEVHRLRRRLAELKNNGRQRKRIKMESRPDPEWSNYTVDGDGVVDLTAE